MFFNTMSPPTRLILSAALFGSIILGFIRNAEAAPPLQEVTPTPIPEVEILAGEEIPLQIPSARAGHGIYQENCAACHGVQGAGDGPTGLQLSSPVAVLADPLLARGASLSDWFQVTKQGRMNRFMPPWKNRLSDEEIWDVAAFSYSLHVSEEELARGEVVWNENCAACHGPQGAGDGPQATGTAMPNLADVAYVANTRLIDWYAIAGAGQGAMPAFAGVLSEEDLWAALEYARTFTYQPMQALALPEGDGRISGLLQNSTPGGDSVAGLTVTLRAFQHFDELRSQSAEVGPDGRFSFDQLPTGENYFYLATVEYKGISFASDFASFQPGSTEQTLTLSVYETSDSPGPISVELAQWFIDPREGALLVGELYRIRHSGDRVYVGAEEIAPGKQAVLTFDLPERISSLSVDGGAIGERYIWTGKSLVDTAPLAPGQTQLLMRYLLPYDGSRAEIAHSVPYPVDEMIVLVAQGPSVAVQGLREVGSQTIADQQWTQYEASNLASGQQVTLKFSGLVRAAAPTRPSSGSPAVLAYNPALLYGLAGGSAGVLLAALAVLLIRSGRPASQADPAPAAEAGQPAGLDAEGERQRLLRAIAALDDQYAAGELDQGSYQRARLAQKRALLVITRQMAQAASPAAEETALP